MSKQLYCDVLSADVEEESHLLLIQSELVLAKYTSCRKDEKNHFPQKFRFSERENAKL